VIGSNDVRQINERSTRVLPARLLFVPLDDTPNSYNRSHAVYVRYTANPCVFRTFAKPAEMSVFRQMTTLAHLCKTLPSL